MFKVKSYKNELNKDYSLFSLTEQYETSKYTLKAYKVWYKFFPIKQDLTNGLLILLLLLTAMPEASTCPNTGI